MTLTPLGVNGPYPAPRGACSSYLVEYDETSILLDCGTGALARLIMCLDLKKLDAVLLTHLHFDHMSDMLPMIYALAASGRASPLPVITPDQPANVRALMNAPALKLTPPADTQIGPFAIKFMWGRHPVPSYCVSLSTGLERMVYTGDTNTQPGLAGFAEYADLLLADAGLLSADWHENAPHLSAALCGSLAAEAKVGKLLLTHLSPKYDSQAILAEARVHFSDAELAHEGRGYRI